MTSWHAGKLIEEEVKTYNDALLLLWRVHNKANQRLSGDISEDPVFPKLVFPSKEFCSSCYDATVTGRFRAILINMFKPTVQAQIYGSSLTKTKFYNS